MSKHLCLRCDNLFGRCIPLAGQPCKAQVEQLEAAFVAAVDHAVGIPRVVPLDGPAMTAALSMLYDKPADSNPGPEVCISLALADDTNYEPLWGKVPPADPQPITRAQAQEIGVEASGFFKDAPCDDDTVKAFKDAYIDAQDAGTGWAKMLPDGTAQHIDPEKVKEPRAQGIFGAAMARKEYPALRAAIFTTDPRVTAEADRERARLAAQRKDPRQAHYPDPDKPTPAEWGASAPAPLEALPKPLTRAQRAARWLKGNSIALEQGPRRK